MRFLILDTDYPDFVRSLYAKRPGLEKQPFDTQYRARMDSFFGIADFYSTNLRALGHEAWDLVPNIEPLQRQWAREHGVPVHADRRWHFRLRRGVVPWLWRGQDRRWLYDILAAQIKQYKPDVLLNQAMRDISSRFLAEMKSHVRLLVGVHAATQLPYTEDYTCYDAVISSFPPTIEDFRKRGIAAEYMRLAFEPALLSSLSRDVHPADISFVGSFNKHGVHSTRADLLEAICARFSQMRIWGTGIESHPESSLIRTCYAGQAWGLEMYNILRNSRITINHHGNIPPYANNLRLYEATGVGTLLITDWKPNLSTLFEPGKEMVAYRNQEECLELIDYYLNHESEREAIARAGQQRTLRDHTYYQRMQELLDIVKGYV